MYAPSNDLVGKLPEHMPMQRLSYDVTFLTPAFLGNANQRGQWRTPPFKSALRHWWRVVWAYRNKFPRGIERMRYDEGRLFGNAWLEGENRRSAVRMHLDHWRLGQADEWGRQDVREGVRMVERQQDRVLHPEVGQDGVVEPQLYLGYGPLKSQRRATVLTNGPAIGSGERAVLSIAAPAESVDDIIAALALMHAYGAVGGRSRNGWGALAVKNVDVLDRLDTDLSVYRRDWRAALDRDWPHALGRDDSGPLIWRTKAPADWRAIMRRLAIVKIDLRTNFKLIGKPPHPSPSERHWLSYPVTNHNVRGWDSKRLPNSLRFKVRRDNSNTDLTRGVIFHVPCLPPHGFKPRRREVERVWRDVHAFLDNRADLVRVRE